MPDLSAYYIFDPIALLVGILFLLAGWLLYWVSLNVAAAILGGGAGLLISSALSEYLEMQAPWDLILAVFSAIACSVLLVALFRYLHHAFFFVFGFLLGAPMGFLVTNQLVNQWELFPSWDPELVLAISIPLMGLLIGLLFVWAHRLLVALATAILGSMLIMEGVEWTWGLLPVFPLMIVGLIIQLKLMKRDEDFHDKES